MGLHSLRREKEEDWNERTEGQLWNERWTGRDVPGLLSRLVILDLVPERPRNSTLEKQSVDSCVGHSSEVSERVVETRSNVSNLVELLPDPGVFDGGLVGGHVDGGFRGRSFSEGELFEGCFSGEDSRLHGVVSSFNLGDLRGKEDEREEEEGRSAARRRRKVVRRDEERRLTLRKPEERKARSARAARGRESDSRLTS